MMLDFWYFVFFFKLYSGVSVEAFNDKYAQTTTTKNQWIQHNMVPIKEIKKTTTTTCFLIMRYHVFIFSFHQNTPAYGNEMRYRGKKNDLNEIHLPTNFPCGIPLETLNCFQPSASPTLFGSFGRFFNWHFNLIFFCSFSLSRSLCTDSTGFCGDSTISFYFILSHFFLRHSKCKSPWLWI